jgi:DNA repair protein RadD
VIFATSVAHSVHLRDEFRKLDASAEHIDGWTPKDERDAILTKLARGNIEIVCNCAVLTEGFDCPDVGCIVLARPTRSLGLFRQMIGRGLRPAPGKGNCIVLDHAGAVHEHGFAEDAVRWTLEPDRRAAVPAHAKRKDTSGKSRLCDCPKCGALRTAGENCRSCGYLPAPKPRAVDWQDGDLARLDRNGRAAKPAFTQAERDRWHRELAGYAKERGYKSGWVFHKFQERFGCKPPWGIPMADPVSPEVRSWVRSRQIAWAKSRDKQRAAAAPTPTPTAEIAPPC